MAKVQIKSEKFTSYGRTFSIMEQFDTLLAQTINSTLGLRCTLYGYRLIYSLQMRFQFHKGSIETVKIKTPKGDLLVFQFHKGSIET